MIIKSLKLIGLTIIALVALSVAGNRPVQAAVTLNPDPGTTIPATVHSYLTNCDSIVPLQSPAFSQWVSPAGNAAAPAEITVPFGTASVSLEYHLAGVVCSSRSAVTDTRTHVLAANPLGISGIVPSAMTLSMSPYNELGRYQRVSQTFSYSPPGGFTASADHTITLFTKPINRFASGSHRCVGGGGTPVSSLDDHGPCPEDTPQFNVRINVNRMPSVEIQADVSCNALPFIARDSDGGAVLVRLLVDGVDSGYSILAPVNTRQEFDISVFQDLRARQFTLLAEDSSGQQATAGPVSPGICSSVECGNRTLVPTNPEPSEQFSVTVNFTFNNRGSSAPNQNYEIYLAITGILPNTLIGSGTISATSGSVSATRGGLSGPAGVYDGTYRLFIGGSEVSPPSPCFFSGNPIAIAFRPYIRTYGGDVFAGGSFATSGCTNPAQIRTFYNETRSPAFSGSSSQFAALALGQITEFASSSLRSGQATSNRMVGLTFANRGTATAYPILGGNLGGEHCISDWFARVDPSVTSSSVSSVNLASEVRSAGTDPQHYLYAPSPVGSAVRLQVPANVAAGKRIAVFVDGDLAIESNIIYDTWPDVGSVPSFYIIARGDIYIAPNVTRLDGVYIAQPNDPTAATVTNGRIWTCASSSGEFLPEDMFDQCKDNKLTVNGAFIAQQVKLQRFFSSIGFGHSDEFPQNETGNCTTRPKVNTDYSCAAEIFNLGPEVYLAKSPFAPLGGGGVSFDSITSLPPVF